MFLVLVVYFYKLIIGNSDQVSSVTTRSIFNVVSQIGFVQIVLNSLQFFKRVELLKFIVEIGV